MAKSKDEVVAALKVKQAEAVQLVVDNWPEPAPAPTPAPVEPPPPVVTPPVVVTPPAPEPEPTQPVPLIDPAVGFDYRDSWETDKSEGGVYSVHSGRNGTNYYDTWDRVSFYEPGRHGKRAIRLTTLAGDVNHGGGNFERCDLKMEIARSGGQKGKKFWYANSAMFPENWKSLPNFSQVEGAYQSIFAWHWDGSTGQGNVNVLVKNWGSKNPTGGGLINDKPHFHVNVWGGVDPGRSGRHDEEVLNGELPVRNQWYDFLWYIEWGSNAGKVKLWCRWGDSKVYKRQFVHDGPTLFRKTETEDYGAYIKVGNYHVGNTGQESSMIHDRVMRGPTMQSVALFPIDIP